MYFKHIQWVAAWCVCAAQHKRVTIVNLYELKKLHQKCNFMKNVRYFALTAYAFMIEQFAMILLFRLFHSILDIDILLCKHAIKQPETHVITWFNWDHEMDKFIHPYFCHID